jgi:SPP1 gp7 family putative phage head morphogenesis protein
MPELIDQAVRLQVLLERVKAGENRRIDEFLREVDKALRDRLSGVEMSGFQRARVEGLLTEIRKALAALHETHSFAFQKQLAELAELAADTEARSLAAALAGFEAVTPAAGVITAAVTTAPLAVRGTGGGMLLEDFIAKWGEADVERIEGVIRRGYFEGQTTEQITRALRGTKAANYADGALAVSRRHARTVAHTAVQHVAHTARLATFEANADVLKGYRWVATLDGKTGELCRSLDGRVFELGKGPRPPAHVNCRSTVAPLTKTFRELGIDLPEMREGTRASQGGQVPASLSYYEWLKTQPADFVEDALGTTRAKLFLKGGIDAEEFARLQLGRNFEPLTLEEMRRKAPKVFRRAGV